MQQDLDNIRRLAPPDFGSECVRKKLGAPYACERYLSLQR